MKQLAALILAGVAALALTGEALPRSRTVEAEKFILKDASGRIRAILGADRSSGKGEPDHGLFLYDASGRARARLAMWGGGTQLVLYDYDAHITSLAGLDAMGRFAGLSLDASPDSAEEPSEGFAELTVGMGGSSFVIGGLVEESRQGIGALASVAELSSDRPVAPVDRHGQVIWKIPRVLASVRSTCC
ncbi:MAG: hypothetical protein ACE5JN_16270 [Candidatus Methylomirabilia bacterium]